VDAAGKLVAMLLVSSNEHEVKVAAKLLGNELSRAVVLAGKGYESNELAAHIPGCGRAPY